MTDTTMPSAIVWRELKTLEPSLFRCDLCGEQADTIHLVPWCGHQCEQALFACERHDPGGYWFTVEKWLDGDRMQRHLEQKIDPNRSDADHPGGVYLLLDRLGQLMHPIVAADETPAGRSTT